MSESTSPPPLAPSAPAPRRRRRGLIAVVVLVVVLVVLAIVAVVAESFARQQATDLVAAEVRTAFDLPADAEVDVQIAGGSVLLQLLGGRLEEVEVQTDDVEVDPFAGDIMLVLSGVPFDRAQPIEALAARVTIPEDVVRTAGAELLDLPFRGLVLEEGLVRVSTAVPLFGTEIPLTVALAPSVDAGFLVLTPTDIALAEGSDIPLGDLLGLLGLDAEGGALAAPRICVDGRVPEGIALQSAVVAGSTIELVLGGEGVVLAGADGPRVGSCG